MPSEIYQFDGDQSEIFELLGSQELQGKSILGINYLHWDDGRGRVDINVQDGGSPTDILDSALHIHLDITAQARGYDSAAACVSYAGSSNLIWAAEAAAMIVWRDACWAYLFGISPPYPSPADMIAALPQIVWPDA